MEMGKMFKQFEKQQRFAKCGGPKSFDDLQSVWQFAQRCAIFKVNSHVCRPDLVITILSNRKTYADLYRSARDSRLSGHLLGSPKQKLEALEKRVGPARFFLRE
jgi:hypothetical protein